METTTGRPPANRSESILLQQILEGTAADTGQAFFKSLVRNLAQALGTYGAWVTDYLPERRRLRARAFWLGDRFVERYEYDIAGTPCEPVVAQCRLLHFPEGVVDLFPGDPDLKKFGAVSYTGMPFASDDGRVLGHLAVLDTKPLAEEPGYLAVFRIFGARAAAELRRLRAEAAVRQREERLKRLIDGAMDGIVDFDERLHIRLINAAAAEAFLVPPNQRLEHRLEDLLTRASADKLRRVIASFDAGNQRRAWLAGGLEARRATGETFAIEASVSQSSADGPARYTLIFRDVNQRLEAERRIRRLEAEAAYLREELSAVEHAGELIGRSAPMCQALQAAEQVAPTDATVLLLGESGTGKELFARAIHALSRREKAALVKVNCAAIPSELVESEFFGHEKGAFTGATARREGRFALAHGGTIFLDEIGDLPPALQAKLLRVLQEGEFEPVGSSTTRKVDVRVIAATHRDLADAVSRGAFREDLYYRLNVFPIRIPPLRERGADIDLLAQAFVERFGRRLGRSLAPLAPDDLARLRAYAWPGNVRELQNVVERAVITARDGRLDLARVLQPSAVGPAPVISSGDADPAAVLTEVEMRRFERDNLRRALEACGWKISGASGAARRLGMKPSTFASRMKALGVGRPPGGS